MTIAMSPFTSAQGAIDAATTPEEACDNLTTFWIQQGVCFTSGHIVHAVRSARQDLVFSQGRIGGYLRGAFDMGGLDAFDDGYGGAQPVVRVARRTVSTGTRTPVGTEVFVYGPTADECDCFEFEINIAEAPQVSDGMGGQTSAATAMLNATPNLAPGTPGASSIPPVQPSGTVAVANGKMVPGNPVAVIHADGRLCIPRIAFEALAFETGVPIVGGEPLNVCFFTSGDGIMVSTMPLPGGVTACPTTDRLRLHLTPLTPQPVGKEFEIKVASDGLRISFV